MTQSPSTYTGRAVAYSTTDPRKKIERVELDYSWTVDDPFALHIDFGEDCVWHTSFELFYNAMADPERAWHGEGDIAVQFCEMSAYIRLLGSDGSGVMLQTPAGPLVLWLQRLREIHDAHRPEIVAAIDRELDAMLTTEA